MNLFTQARADVPAQPMRLPPDLIEIVEPDPENCPTASLPPEGKLNLRNYRIVNNHLRMYTPTGDIHTTPAKGKLVSKFDVCSTLSPPRAKILELLRPEDPGRDALEAIVRPAPRRGLARPLDEDTRRFLQRALLSPSPQGLSAADTPESQSLTPEPQKQIDLQTESIRNTQKSENEKDNRSLADELKEAEEDEKNGSNIRRELLRRFRRRGGGVREAVEREKLGKLALSMEEDEEESEDKDIAVAARRLDALLAESRDLHEELADIQEDMQAQSARAVRCAAAARALVAETRALRFLDDVVALLRGDVGGVARARAWPFAIGRRQHGKNYVI